MDYGLHDLVGNVGVLLIVGSYLWVQLGRLSAVEPPYIVANGAGALLILYSLAYDFNLSAFVIELTWLLISLLGLWRYYRHPRGAPRAAPAESERRR